MPHHRHGARLRRPDPVRRRRADGLAQRSAGRLHPPAGLPRLWPARRGPDRHPPARDHRHLAAGWLLRGGGARARDPPGRLELAPHGAGHAPGAGQGGGQLPQLADDQARGTPPRLRRRCRARHRRLHLRDQRRQPVPGARGGDLDALGRLLDPARHHARVRDQAGTRAGPGGARGAHPAQRALRRRRDLRHRQRSRGDRRHRDRRPPDRQGRRGPGHPGPQGGLPGHRPRTGRGPLRLDDLGAVRCQAPSTGTCRSAPRR